MVPPRQRSKNAGGLRSASDVLVESLDDGGDALADADAHGRHTIAAAALLHRGNAPSDSGEEFPAVTVPPFLNDGCRAASFSKEVSARGPSSLLWTIGAPFFWGISNGMISSLRRPSSYAFSAF